MSKRSQQRETVRHLIEKNKQFKEINYFQSTYAERLVHYINRPVSFSRTRIPKWVVREVVAEQSF